MGNEKNMEMGKKNGIGVGCEERERRRREKRREGQGKKRDVIRREKVRG